MTFTGKSFDLIMKKYFIFRYGLFLLFLLGAPFISGCNSDGKCTGCDKDPPWSNTNSHYCYPTKGQCESTEGEDCEPCD